MSVSDLPTTAQNYLKVIWNLAEWTGGPATIAQVAARMGLSASTVSAAIRRLDEAGLVGHPRYGAVELTAAGRAHALSMVRRHRLIETFLAEVLSYCWDEVHDEAEHLEHAVSDELVNRIDKLLGHPTKDPHGDPIPSADGNIRVPDATCLSELAGRASVVVERISDADPEVLRFLSDNHIAPGTRLDLQPSARFSTDAAVHVTDRDGYTRTATLGRAAADAIWVSTARQHGPEAPARRPPAEPSRPDPRRPSRCGDRNDHGS